ncbi:hypothetical protein [Kitasatospora sp. NPDC047058]|uniref:hypothetical protein n=1 Tax=Kitasatospora sp. NPDC047058 TaxID=3155620 RepID=UPI0033F7FCF7
MNGTITRISRASAGTTAVVMAATGVPGNPRAGLSPWRHGDVLIGSACGSTVRRHLPGRTHVGGRLHGGIAGPGSTESPHVVRPAPEAC